MLAENIPITGNSNKIDLKAIMEGLSLKTNALKLKKDLIGKLETNVT